MNQNQFPFKKRENPFATPTESTPKKVEKVDKRDKYTATMESNLRIRLKIASAKKGIQFSQYIEEAVLEKLEREGE